MKVLNLRCSHQHLFEGWFGSEEDFQGQLARNLVECPLCGDKGIQKLPSAPRLNLGAYPDVQTASGSAGQSRPPSAPAALAPLQVPGASLAATMPDGLDPAEQAAFLNVLRDMVKNTEDVGQRFAEEARRMHYGETETRSIRGQASAREAVELLEEGIEVMPLPMLPSLKETLQ